MAKGRELRLKRLTCFFASHPFAVILCHVSSSSAHNTLLLLIYNRKDRLSARLPTVGLSVNHFILESDVTATAVSHRSRGSYRYRR